MDVLRDNDIPTVRVPNPILDKRAKGKLAHAKDLFTPTIPLSVVKRAQAATSTGALVLSLVGLVVKLTHSPTVHLAPNIVSLFGIGEYQLKRGLKALAHAGLVRVRSERGWRREVTLTDAEFLEWLQHGRH